MNDLNYCIIEGNLVKDPISRSTKSGVMICSFSVACDRHFKGPVEIEKEVSFFDVEAWGDLAGICVRLGRKGRGVRIRGRLKQERWEAADGHRSKVVVVAEYVEWKPEKIGSKADLDSEKNENREAT
jgi:single-strand DNA-binding protein